MSRQRRPLLALGLSAAAILGYLMLWLQIDQRHIGRSDFTATYMGATLLREGSGSSMYDERLQTPLHDQLIAPDHEGNLPFVNPPLAAAIAMPVSLLDLNTAYRVWSMFQFVLLALAAAIAIRAAPGRASLRRVDQVAIALVALACLGTWTLVVQGQWDGVPALGLAGAYAALRARRPAAAGALLAVTSMIAKPHLALGLAAFVIGRRDRRFLLGAIAGVAVSIVASVLVAGPAGVGGFIGAALHSTTRWELRNMLSLVGIAGTVAGDTTVAHVIATVASLTALGLAAAMGASVRTAPGRLEAALAGATVLSLLASPHAYSHDLTLLVPALAWSLTAAAARQPESRRVHMAIVAVWVAISAAAYVDIVSGAGVPPGQLAPWALIAAAALAARLCLRGRAQQPAAGQSESRAPDPSTITPAGYLSPAS